MTKKLFSFLRRFGNRNVFSKEGLIFAFEHKGINYYGWENPMNMPFQRQWAAQGIYNSLDMRITNEMLQLHLEAMKKIVNSSTFNVIELVQIILELEQRNKRKFDVDALYQYASIVFVAEDEKFDSYDVIYNDKKIKNWKDGGLHDFFSAMPIKLLIPQLASYTKEYLILLAENYQKRDQEIVTNLTAILSETPSTTLP